MIDGHDSTTSQHIPQPEGKSIQFRVRESSSHSWRTELPNIIFQLGLSPHQFRIYCEYKRIAGDGGTCYKSQPTLAKETGISVRTIRECKKALARPFPQLDGRPLIIIESRMTDKGDSDTDNITICDIWPKNFENFIGAAGDAGGVRQEMPGGPAGDADKEEPFKKNPKNNNRTKPSAAVFSCLRDLDIIEDEKIWISKKYSEDAVIHAVKWVTDPNTVIKTTFIQTLKWACKNQPTISATTEQKIENDKQKAKAIQKKITKIPKGIKLEMLNKYVEIGNGTHQPSCVKFGSSEFDIKFVKELKRWGFELSD